VRRLVFDEGNGVVEVQRGRATVRHRGRYLGQAHHRHGRWHASAQPGVTFRGPVELAEALADAVVAA
jgi:hypothetical protein